jgi:hypothetical protein
MTACAKELTMGVNWGQNRRNDPQGALAFIEGLLIECDAGAGETVLVGGGPASGKSQVQNQVVARARELGILTLTAAGAADERDVDGGVIDQLLAGPALPRAITGPLTEGANVRCWWRSTTSTTWTRRPRGCCSGCSAGPVRPRCCSC